MTSKNWKGHSDRRWIEDNYTKYHYPRYALGGAGYVISRPVAEYIASEFQNLTNYVLEDASMGIWIDESPLKNSMHYIQNSKQFWTSGRCADRWKATERKKPPFVIGHSLDSERMLECHDAYRNQYDRMMDAVGFDKCMKETNAVFHCSMKWHGG